MSDQRLRVFVSSKMQELAPERVVIKAALDSMGVAAWMFEEDAGARPQTIQETYLDEVESADLYIGLFWKGYGAYTIDEFEHARTLGMDCLIYEKRDDVTSQRDPKLQAFLDSISDVERGLTIRWFNTSDELGRFVKEDVAAWQARTIREAKRSTAPAIYVGVPQMPTHFVGRDEIVVQMARRLQAGEDLSMEGLPGVGKTMLAVALTRHVGVRRHFKDGVLFASLGPHGDATRSLLNWANALGTNTANLARAPQLSQAVKDSIGQRRMLLVIDDAWNLDAATSLRCGGPNCGHLVTTRDKAIARAFAGTDRTFPLPTLDDAQAYQMLKALAPEACAANPARVQSLLRAVGGLPLAISLMGGYLSAPERSMYAELFPDLSEKALAEISDPLRRLQLAEKRLGVPSGESETLGDTIALSLEELPDHTQQVFYALGAFAPAPERFSLEAAGVVTEAGNIELAVLAARNLVQVSRKDRQLAIHPVVADVAHKHLREAVTARHAEFYLAFARKHGHRNKFSPFHFPAHDWSPVADAYGQIKQAWRNLPDDASLLDWLDVLQPYFRRRDLWQEYLKWANRALQMVTSQGRRRDDGPLRSNMGLAHYSLSECDEATGQFEAALPILEEFDRAGYGRTLHNMGMVHLARGEQASALDLMVQAQSVLGGTDDTLGLAATWVDIGEILKQSGHTQQADACFKTASALFNKTDDGPVDDAPVTTVYMTTLFRQAQDLRKPFLLFLINKSVELGGFETDFEGHIVIGVKRDADGTYEYWHAVFTGGKKVEGGYIDYLPGDADVMVLLEEQEATAVLEGTYQPKPGSVTGDSKLLVKFVESYLRLR